MEKKYFLCKDTLDEVWLIICKFHSQGNEIKTLLSKLYAIAKIRPDSDPKKYVKLHICSVDSKRIISLFKNVSHVHNFFLTILYKVYRFLRLVIVRL